MRDDHQDETIPVPEGLPDDVVVSPDTRRADRLPPNQVRTRKWPVLDAHGPPSIDAERWRLRVHRLVEEELELDWEGLQALARVKVFADMHCVTRWSRLGNLWEGVATRELLASARPKPEARYVVVHGHDFGFTTNLPLEAFLAEDALVADRHDGRPIPLPHGGPLRLVVPRLYAWKSAKWVSAIELVAEDRPGFWERVGYHSLGDPWREERFG